MLKTFNWQEAIHDPRFWAVRYHCDGKYRQFPGVTGEESNSYIDEYDFLQVSDPSRRIPAAFCHSFHA